MNAISYTVVRARLAETMSKVCEEHEPVIITRSRGASVVMMSQEDYEAMKETNYLLRNPANARHLLAGIAELDASGGKALELPE